jgi:hypothetical protein
MTPDRCGHLFGDRLNEVAERMAVARDAAVARVLPEALSPEEESAGLRGSSPR